MRRWSLSNCAALSPPDAPLASRSLHVSMANVVDCGAPEEISGLRGSMNPPRMNANCRPCSGREWDPYAGDISAKDRPLPRNRYHSGSVTDHFDGLRFHTPGQPSPDRSLRDIWRWRRESERAPWPAKVEIVPAVPLARSEAPRITMVGHATVLIQVAGLNILTDPVWSRRAGPWGRTGPKRVTAPGIAFDDLPRIDVVLVSHNHYDHLDVATLRRLHRRDRPQMVMPLGTDATARRAAPDMLVRTADWHDRVELASGVAVTLTPANHWSSRGLTDRRMALWCGFWIDSPQARIWFAGDTGWGDGAIFADIHARHGAPDVALIPIGAYAPRWFMAPQHVDPEEAVRIFTRIGARRAYGIHWGTFQLTDEPREEPRDLLAHHLVEAGVDPARFVALEPGAVVGGIDAA